MRRAVIACALCLVLLAGSLTPAFAHGRLKHQTHHAHHHHSMCTLGTQGTCNPGLTSSEPESPQWECHPIMGPAAPGHVRSGAWVCGWV